MTTSGTYSFTLTGGDLLLECFDRIGVRGSELRDEHMQSARLSCGICLLEWGNKGVNLWAVDNQVIALTQGVANYPVPVETVMILDALVTPSGAPDRVVTPISRTDYNNIPNKAQQGPPTSYWFDRLITPSVTLWPTPDATVETFSYYRMRDLQDMSLNENQTLDMPRRMMPAFCADLTAALAWKYPKGLPQGMTPKDYDAAAAVAWGIGAGEDRERVSLFLRPDFSGYFR